MNVPRRRGPIARVFVGAWGAINFTRRLVFNLLFLLFLLVLVVAIAAGDRAKPLLERSTLVIAPEGALVEQYSIDPFSRALADSMGEAPGEVQLRDLLRALEAAAGDTRIERVLLRTDRLTFGGHAALREVASGVARLRASGKQVIAYGDYFEQAQYLLAAQAGEVYLDPDGGVLLEGLARYRQFYREGLVDKLGVDMHLFKVGEFKSAAEPFILDAASEESKQADLFWMNDVWNRFLADIGRARRIAPRQLAADIEVMPAAVVAANGDLGRYALERKLVDGLKTRQQVEQLLIERGVADDDAEGGFRQIQLAAYLKHVDNTVSPGDTRPQVAVVVAEGSITGGEQPPGTIGGESTAELLRDAREDEHVKALVLRVDSPGGEVFASEQIRREVVALKAAGKPVVVSMGDLAASGGYWISMNADRIYANESTITGSIGIFGLIPTFPRALEKIGVRTDGVGTTRFAGAFDVTRPLAPETGQVVQAVINKGYRDFTGRVATARGKPVAEVDAVARGRVWSGAQARERGLVDAFGGIDDAVADAAGRAKLGAAGSWRMRYMEKSSSPFERWFGGFASSRAGAALLHDSSIAQAMLAKLAPDVARDLAFLERAMAPGGAPVKVLAHCFCGF